MYSLPVPIGKSLQKAPLWGASLTTLFVFTSFMDPINLPKLIILTLTASISLISIRHNFKTYDYECSPSLLIATLPFPIILVISTFQSDRSLLQSLLGTWGRNNGTLCYLAFFTLFVAIANSRSTVLAAAVVNHLCILGIFLAFYGLLQFTGNDPFTWNNDANQIILTFGNSDFASAFLGVAAVASVSKLFQKNTSKFFRYFMPPIIFIELFLIFASQAKQGLVIAFFGINILVAMRTYYSLNPSKRKVFWLGLSFNSILYIIAGAGLIGKGPLSPLFLGDRHVLGERYHYAVTAINIIKDNLIFGVGIDALGDWYRRYRTLAAIEQRGSAEFSTNNVHNVFLQLGSTGGIILLIAYVLLLSFVVRRAWITLVQAKDKSLAITLISLWLSFQMQTLVSVDQIGLAIWGWILGGAIVAISYSELVKPSLKKITFRTRKLNTFCARSLAKLNLGIVFVAIVFTFIVIDEAKTEYRVRNSIIAMIQSDREVDIKNAALELFEFSNDSAQPEVKIQAAKYLIQVDNQLASKLAESTAEGNKNSFQAWDYLATIFEGNSDWANAIKARKMAIKLDPNIPRNYELLEIDQSNLQEKNTSN
jgi:hypothetical protein